MKKKGIIILQIPNTDGFSSGFFGPNWAEWDVPRHFTHFNKKNIRRYMEAAGFKVKRIKNTGSHFQFTQSIKYSSKSKNIKRIMDSSIMKILFTIIASITMILNMPGRIEVYATK